MSLTTPTSPMRSGHCETRLVVMETSSPIFWFSTACRMCWRPGMKRIRKPTVRWRSFSWAVWTSCRAWSGVVDMGFSTRTCLPAFSAFFASW